jgi:ABC-2 type transport system ATP-binding protein
VITVTDLSMHYGPVVALRQATFNVERGEVVGLLGPNGAGKSTTMKILTTYLYPTSGTATVGGKNVLTEPLAVRQVLGYLPEVLPLYPDMEVRTYLDFVGRARGLQGDQLRQRLAWAVQRCGLQPMYRKLIRELSKGYRQRVGLAQALMHDPQVVMLDEPTSGLDPHQILEIRQLIRELAHDKTILLSTHILQEVEAIADRVVIINEGRIVADGSMRTLQEQTQQYDRAVLAVIAEPKEVEAALRTLPQVTYVRYLRSIDDFAAFEIHAALGAQVRRHISALMLAKGWQVGELRLQHPTLEEMFLSFTASHHQARSEGA